MPESIHATFSQDQFTKRSMTVKQSSRQGEVDPTMKVYSVQRCRTILKRPRHAQPGMVAAAPFLHADSYAVLEILGV